METELGLKIEVRHRQPEGHRMLAWKDACLMFFSGFHVKREPLPGTLYMPVSGGGWIVLGLVFKDRFVV